MQINTRNIFTYPFLLTWFILSLVVYIYISQISFVPIVTLSWGLFAEMLTHISPVRYILNLIGAWLGTTLFSLACISLGLGILRKWVQYSSKLALGVTAFFTGEILFSLIFLIVISLSRLTPAFVAITILLGFLIGLPALKQFITHIPFRSSLFTGFEWSERILLGLILIGTAFGLLLSSSRLGYDATAAYFSQAKIMAVSQMPIFFTPKDFFVVTSFHPGILFTALIQLFGDQSARTLSWVNGVAMMLMGLALGEELGLTRRARLWFLILMVTSTAFTDLLGDGKIELISAAPILAAVYWMLQSLKQPTRGTFVVIGWLAGFALISRPYNIFLVSVFMSAFFFTQIFALSRTGYSDLKRFIFPVLSILPPMLFLGVFHLVENWFFLKNPLAPLAYGQGLETTDWQWQFDPANLPLYRLFYPFTLTYMNSAQSLGNISPLLIAFLPFLFVKSVRENIHISSRLFWLSLIAVLTLLLWITLTFTVVEIRYVLFLWAILFLAIAQILEGAIQHAGSFVRPLLLSLVMIFLAVMSTRTLMIALSTYFPLDDTKRCLDNNLCVFLETLNQPAQPGDRVFVLHGYRYYLRSDLFACSSRVDEYPALDALARQNSPDFWAEVYRQGFRFIIFEQHLSEVRYGFGKLPSPDIAPDWMKVKVLYSSTNATQRIYQLEAINPPIQPEILCKQNAKGMWELTYSSMSRLDHEAILR